MLDDYLRQIEEAENVDEEENVYGQIHAYAQSNREEFVRQVRGISLDRFSDLDEIYEALSFDPADWQDFFLEELERLLSLARSQPNSEAILAPLDAFFLLSFEQDKGLMQAILRELAENVSDENVFIRRKCVELLGDFVDRKDFKELRQLEHLAQKDPDWQVRYLAYQALEDVDPERAGRVRLPRWIKWRARLAGWHLS
jgi:HEAT repeat protein